MRGTARLLASLSRGRFLEPNAPTGLTGLHTHPAPRSTLIYLYSSILEKLKGFPDSSAYRTSTEALTKHRLSIIESIKPPGFDEWAKRAEKVVADHPDIFKESAEQVGKVGPAALSKAAGRKFVHTVVKEEGDERLVEWDGEAHSYQEGPNANAETAIQKAIGVGMDPDEGTTKISWEPEPPLEARQVEEIEQKIGGGLIEEVIQVAEGELKLIDTLAEAKVWEELEEKPVEGQWTYFERSTHQQPAK